jgi:hypothetical protein
VSCFTVETTAPMLGSKNRMESPNTQVKNNRTKVTKREEIENLRKAVLTSKVMNPFHVPSCPLL